jgi:hypothetical protein
MRAHATAARRVRQLRRALLVTLLLLVVGLAAWIYRGDLFLQPVAQPMEEGPSASL